MKLEELLKLEKINDEVIAFPTDTVYGVGTKISSKAGIKKIYSLKERDFNKPLAVLVGSLEDAICLVDYLPKEAIDLIKKHWPGALTIICKKSKTVPEFLNPEFETIGIRMPNSISALEILKKYGPMAVTSINKSGEPALNDYDIIYSRYHNDIDYILESNEISSNVSSTVVEIINEEIKVLRQGSIIIK